MSGLCTGGLALQEAGPDVLTSLTAATWGCHTEGAGQHVVGEKQTGEDVLWWATSYGSRVVTSPHGGREQMSLPNADLDPSTHPAPTGPESPVTESPSVHPSIGGHIPSAHRARDTPGPLWAGLQGALAQ